MKNWRQFVNSRFCARSPDGKHPSAPECNTNLLRLPIDQPTDTNKQNGGGRSETSWIFATFSLLFGCFRSSTLGKGKACRSVENMLYILIGLDWIAVVWLRIWVWAHKPWKLLVSYNFATSEYPSTPFTCVGVLWRTRNITIVAILIQWDAVQPLRRQ